MYHLILVKKLFIKKSESFFGYVNLTIYFYYVKHNTKKFLKLLKHEVFF